MSRRIQCVFIIAAVAGALAGALCMENGILTNAERLVRVGAFDEAITEYKRYLYCQPESASTAIYLSIADLYRQCGGYAQAKQTLQHAMESSTSDSINDAIRIRQALLSIAEGDYASAELELLRIRSFSSCPSLRKRAELFLCVGYIFSSRYDEAKRISGSHASGGTDRYFLIIDSLLKKEGVFPHKSRRTARWLSTFLPGSGQLYAHDMKNGINALAISIVTGFMTVNSIIGGYYQEAILTDMTLFWRYYSGNRAGAVHAVDAYNQKRDSSLRKKILGALPETHGQDIRP